MSTFGEGQVRKFFIATASTDAGVADIDHLSEGEVQAFASNGKKATGATEKFLVATKKDGEKFLAEIVRNLAKECQS